MENPRTLTPVRHANLNVKATDEQGSVLLGFPIDYKSFVKTISNPFYCGYVTHSLIPGEMIQGHHPALISEAAFLSANRIAVAEPRNGIAKKIQN